AVIAEILSHQQGWDDVIELLTALSLLDGKQPVRPIYPITEFTPVPQDAGYFHTAEELQGSICDKYPDGFLLQLPQAYRLTLPNNPKAAPTCEPTTAAPGYQVTDYGTEVVLDCLYVPKQSLRQSWQHPTGLWGLNELGAH